jgi:protein-tyrosine phosphatase
MSQLPPLAPTQQSRLKQFQCARVVDVHCHILPGVDDGPQDLKESIALARMLVEEGVTDVIATPHQLGRWDGANTGPQVRQAVDELQNDLTRSNIPLRVHPGGEIRLDERVPALLRSEQVLTLADHKRWLLLELPPSVGIAPKPLAGYLRQTGAGIVLAHAERYDCLTADANSAAAWIDEGVAFQVNAASLFGASGERARQAAWTWLERGWVSIIASDAHSTNTRRPRMAEAVDAIVRRSGQESAFRVCIDNPLRVLEGLELV